MWLEKGNVSLKARPCDLALQARLDAPLANSSLWLRFLVFLAPWCSGQEVGFFRDLEAVAFFVTTWAKSIQTTALHGLGYSTMLACLLSSDGALECFCGLFSNARKSRLKTQVKQSLNFGTKTVRKFFLRLFSKAAKKNFSQKKR